MLAATGNGSVTGLAVNLPLYCAAFRDRDFLADADALLRITWRKTTCVNAPHQTMSNQISTKFFYMKKTPYHA
jgi:hypothetical protein